MPVSSYHLSTLSLAARSADAPLAPAVTPSRGSLERPAAGRTGLKASSFRRNNSMVAGDAVRGAPSGLVDGVTIPALRHLALTLLTNPSSRRTLTQLPCAHALPANNNRI